MILIMAAAINRTPLSKTRGSPNSSTPWPLSSAFSTSSACPLDGVESAKPVLADRYKKHAEAPGADDQTLGLILA